MPRPLLHRLVSVVGLAVTVAAVVGLAAAVVVPRLGGATPYAVLTGSMTPAHEPGSLVVVRPVRAAEVEPGQVVTYQLESGKPATATHRVVDRAVTLASGVVLQTQGDANSEPDQAWVQEAQLRGQMWYAVPHLGWLHVWLTGAQHQLLVYVAAALLGLHALVMFGRALRQRRRGVAEQEVRHDVALV